MGLHVLAILFYTFGKKQALVGAMLHGDKQATQPATPSSRDTWGSRAGALGVLLACAALVRWVV